MENKINNPWNADRPKSYIGMWLGSKAINSKIQKRITGDPNTHWLDYYTSRYCQSFFHNPSSRCLILGANEGTMERHLRAAGFAGRILSTDIADRALARAEQESRRLGLTNIEYRLADLNTDTFDGPFDMVVAEGVLHHIEKTERILRHIHDILTPSGFLLAVEWAGPFRFQLPANQVRWINALLAAVPAELRPLYEGPAGVPPPLDYLSRIHYVIAPEASVRDADPTEAIAGEPLRQLLPEVFDIAEWRGFGGTFLSYMTGHFPFELADTDPYVRSFAEMLYEMEQRVIESGLFQDEFFTVAAHRKVSQ